MKPKLVESFEVVGSGGRKLTLHVWQGYHQIPGTMHNPLPEWVPDAFKFLTTENGEEVLAKNQTEFWIKRTSEELVRQA